MIQIVQRRKYREDVDLSTRDYYHAYRDLGGKFFKKEEFFQPYNLLFLKLFNYMRDKEEDIKVPYLNYTFRFIMSNSNKKTIDWKDTWEVWRKAYPGKTNTEISKITGKPTKRVVTDKVYFKCIKSFKRGKTKFFKLKTRLYVFDLVRSVKSKVTQSLIEGKLYMYR